MIVRSLALELHSFVPIVMLFSVKLKHGFPDEDDEAAEIGKGETARSERNRATVTKIANCFSLFMSLGMNEIDIYYFSGYEILIRINQVHVIKIYSVLHIVILTNANNSLLKLANVLISKR